MCGEYGLSRNEVFIILVMYIGEFGISMWCILLSICVGEGMCLSI